MELFSIGKLSKQSGIAIETIRFYEKQRLLPKPKRTGTGYRQYNQGDLQRISFIKRSKDLGFTLAEIKELLSLKVGGKTTCADVRRKAELKIKDIEGRVAELQRIKLALKTLSSSCKGTGPAGECPILDALSANGGKS